MSETLHEHETILAEEEYTLVCANHPDRETSLRCNRCEKPICTRCAVLTPTGYRCKECVRGQQKVFETAEPQDYFIAPVLAVAIAYLGGLFVPRLGFFTLFLAPGVGALIAEAVRFAIRRRRSRRLFQITAGAVAGGSLLPVCSSLLGLALTMITLRGGIPLGYFGFSLIWQGVYAFIATSTVYYRLSGISLRV